jgi:hypothetical protein
MISEGHRLLVTTKYHGVYFFSKKKENLEKKKAVDTDQSMMCKFVVDGTGKRIGESVSMTEDMLIIKAGARFLGVPLKHVEAGEKTLVVKGLIDFSKAYALGEEWRKESYREMDEHEKPERRC